VFIQALPYDKFTCQIHPYPPSLPRLLPDLGSYFQLAQEAHKYEPPDEITDFLSKYLSTFQQPQQLYQQAHEQQAQQQQVQQQQSHEKQVQQQQSHEQQVQQQQSHEQQDVYPDSHIPGLLAIEMQEQQGSPFNGMFDAVDSPTNRMLQGICKDVSGIKGTLETIMNTINTSSSSLAKDQSDAKFQMSVNSALSNILDKVCSDDLEKSQ